MSGGSVKIDVPFDALVAAISALSVEEKRRLFEILDDQLMAEEGNAQDEAAVAEARAEMAAGDYTSLDDYTAGKDAQ